MLKSLKQQRGEKLTLKQELFCQYYGSWKFLGQSKVSYMLAYGLDPMNEKDHAVARASGYRLLGLDKILTRIDEVLHDLILNDASVDSKLAFWIFQKGDAKVSMAGIKEYNRLKGRITKKVEETHVHDLDDFYRDAQLRERNQAIKIHEGEIVEKTEQQDDV